MLCQLAAQRSLVGGNFNDILTLDSVAFFFQISRHRYPSKRSQAPFSLHNFYDVSCIRCGNFTKGGLILVDTMTTLPLSLRGVGLTLLIAAAICHADWGVSVAAQAPHIAGLGRLGRDLVRRNSGEVYGTPAERVTSAT